MAEEKTQKEIKLNRDDSVPGLLKELDAFINHPDAHEKVMADFDQQYCKKYSEAEG
jgi:hypothetical protein